MRMIALFCDGMGVGRVGGPCPLVMDATPTFTAPKPETSPALAPGLAHSGSFTVCRSPRAWGATLRTMSSDRCVHDLPAGTCSLGGPQRGHGSRRQNFVRILPRPHYHLADCDEVTWDPTDAENPGERVELTPEQVRPLLADGALNRGGLCCGANANLR